MAEGVGEESASGSTSLIFVSYASRDAAFAEAIVASLENHGLRCWIAPRDVTAGAPYAGQIIRAIDAANASVLVMSEHAASSPHVLREVERTASKRHPIIALRIDQTPLPADFEYFLNASHWLDTSTADIERVLPKLVAAVQFALQAPAVTPAAAALSQESTLALSPRPPKRVAMIVASVIGLGLAVFAVDRLWIIRQRTATTPALAPATAPLSPTGFNPPPHSIAVLPFVNMSGDKAQDYFSDGLSEELLNDLSRINDLQVAARTSAFSFKGKDTDIGTIGRKLNVGAVLEGSVRRSAHTVRITAQLINAVTGFHMWSQTYDRDLGDLLRLQTEIASAVANALKPTLLGNVAARIELGGTRNLAAFDAYLRGTTAFGSFNETKELQVVIAAFTEAIRLDPNYALALAKRSVALSLYAASYAKGPTTRESFDMAEVDARKAIALAPDLAEGHAALAYILEAGSLDFKRAAEEYERATAISPGNAFVLIGYGHFAVLMGRTEAAIDAMRRAVTLNPLDAFTRSVLGQVLYWAHQYDESIATYRSALILDRDNPDAYIYRGLAYYALGNFQEARATCEAKPDDALACLAITYDKLGQHADAQAMLDKLKALGADRNALEIATIYAQWGNSAKAMEWLEVALGVRDSWLVVLRADPLFDPMRKEPRFRAIERALKFPQQ